MTMIRVHDASDRYERVETRDGVVHVLYRITNMQHERLCAPAGTVGWIAECQPTNKAPSCLWCAALAHGSRRWA